jgi:hypothetical protein
MSIRSTLCGVLFLVSGVCPAADLSGLKALFQQEFLQGYEEGKCGLNIDGFVKKAAQKKIDLTCALLVHVEGGGDVSAKFARSRTSEPTKRTWFHHYIMIAPPNRQCKSSGYALRGTDSVIDFDFGNSPRVLPLKEYLETMWVPNRVVSDPNLARTDFTMGITSFSAVDAYAYLKAIQVSDPRRASTLKKDAVVIEKITLRSVYLSL